MGVVMVTFPRRSWPCPTPRTTPGVTGSEGFRGGHSTALSFGAWVGFVKQSWERWALQVERMTWRQPGEGGDVCGIWGTTRPRRPTAGAQDAAETVGTPGWEVRPACQTTMRPGRGIPVHRPGPAQPGPVSRPGFQGPAVSLLL